jgi:4-hydroxy-tetrahydrodipicolinate reductase
MAMAGGLPVRLGVAGALGAMGRSVTALAQARGDVRLAALFDRPDTAAAARKPLTTRAKALRACDVIIDFSTPAASAELAALAASAGGPALVIGSTGLSEPEETTLRAAAQSIAIVKSGNFSLGINILAGLVEQTARRLGPEIWDVEVFEAHHRRKRDAPSGTALMLGAAAARGRGEALIDVAAPPREGAGEARRQGDVGFAVMRAGGIIGEHAVVFAADDEILTLSHSARDRGLFARGALEAALWVVGRPPGLYDMIDVLGFRDA